MATKAKAVADATPEPETTEATEATQTVARRKVNRGSTRRIIRAHEAFDKAIEAFLREMDLQTFTADDEGERTGPAPLVTDLAQMRDHVRASVNQIVEG